MITKRCKFCQETKPLSEFYKKKQMKDGYYNHCKSCHSERYTKKWYKENKSRRKELSDQWRSKNRKRWNELIRKQYHSNIERSRELGLKYERRRSRIKSSPVSKPWKEAIDFIYENCPEGYHVDHIVPLQGKNVCGLHVPWNLRFLSVTENLLKSNRVPDDETTCIFTSLPFSLETYYNSIRIKKP